MGSISYVASVSVYGLCIMYQLNVVTLLESPLDEVMLILNLDIFTFSQV